MWWHVQQDIVGEQGDFPQVEFPVIFGHEGAGIVRAIGSKIAKDDPDLKLGDAVVCCYNYCGSCAPCAAGRPAACARHADANLVGLRVSDGSTPVVSSGSEKPVRFQFYGQSSFARMSVVSGKSYVRCPFPESIDYYCALGCGFQTGAGTILNALKPRPTQSVAVFGVGGVGMTAIMACRIRGVQTVIAVDRFADKLALARTFGATHTVNTAEPSQSDIPKAIAAITGGAGADFVVECTGAPPLLDAVFDSLAAEGVGAVLGVPPVAYTMPVKPLDMILDNKTLRGIVQGESISRKVCHARCTEGGKGGSNGPSPPLHLFGGWRLTADGYTIQFLPEMMELHRSGKFPVDKLCKIYPMSDLDVALEDVRSGKVCVQSLRQRLQYLDGHRDAGHQADSEVGLK